MVKGRRCALFRINEMAGKVEPSDDAEEARVRRENPSFAKLLDILNNSRLQDGRSKETSNRLKQVNSL